MKLGPDPSDIRIRDNEPLQKPVDEIPQMHTERFTKVLRAMEDRDGIFKIAAEMGYSEFLRKNAVRPRSGDVSGLLFEADPSADPVRAYRRFSTTNLPDGTRLERYRLENNQVLFFHRKTP